MEKELSIYKAYICTAITSILTADLVSGCYEDESVEVYDVLSPIDE